MGSPARQRTDRIWLRGLLAAGCGMLAAGTWAASSPIYSCIDANGKRLTSDRPIAERKPLIDEAEFYQGKQMPAKLKQALDANDAATDAQRALIQNQQAEIGRINALYDAELGRLRKLWSGAPAGSMGALPVAPAASG